MAETKVPAIKNIPAKLDSETKLALESIKEAVEVRLGRRGDPKDRAVTLRELIDSGLATDLAQSPYNPNTGATGFGPIGERPGDVIVPPAPTVLTADGVFTKVLLAWNQSTNAAPYGNHGFTEIWRSQAEDLSSAVLVGTTNAFIYTDEGVDYGSTHYYWVRFVSTSNTPGPWSNMASATTIENIAATMAALSEELQNLPGYTALTTLITNGDVATAATAAAAATAATAATAALAAIAATIIRSTSAPTTRVDGSALIQNDVWIDTDDNNQMYIRNSSNNGWEEARDGTLVTLVNSVNTQQGTNTTNIASATSDIVTLTTANSSRVSEITTLQSTINNASTGLAAAHSAISSEATTRANADTALATDITSLTSTVGTNTSAISSEATTRANADTALATDITSLTSTVGTNTSAISSEATTRANADTALATDITSLTSTVGTNTSAISSEATTRANADTALATDITSLTTTVTNNNNTLTSAINTEATTRANADTALATDITSLTSTVGTNTSAISSEATTRANADTALATDITSLTSTVGTNTSAISSEATTRADADTALATDITSLTTTVTNNNNTLTSAINTEATTRATADSTNATNISNLTSTINNGSTGLAAAHSAISSEATTRADADTANALSISNLSTTVGTTNSNVSTLQTSVSNLEGDADAMYVIQVATESNGSKSAAGMVIGSNANSGSGAQSYVQFQADKFAVWSGSASVAPFIISSGVVYIDDARIKDGAITNARIATGTIETAKIGDAQITTAKIANLQVTNALIADATIEDAKINTLNATKINAGLINSLRINADTLNVKHFDNVSTDIINQTGGRVPLAVYNSASQYNGSYPGDVINSVEAVYLPITVNNVRNSATYQVLYSAVLGDVRNGTLQYSFNGSTWVSLSPVVAADAGVFRTYAFMWQGTITGMSTSQETVYWRMNFNVSGSVHNSTYQSMYVYIDNTT
jgi:hypothetical protein